MSQSTPSPLLKMAWLPLVVATVGCLATTSADAAGMLLADGQFGGRMEIKQQDVRVTINNGIAVTEVSQVFVNTEDRQVEALYVFPVPKAASVANFSMMIGGKEMIGEVVEKERAREIYNSYKRVRRDPGLLEQVDYKRFEMRIFPIGPRAEQHVRIEYYQELDFDHDAATYVYPLATTSESGMNQQTTGRFSFAIDVRSEVPIVELSSPSHADDFVIASHSPEYQQASLEIPQGEIARDVVLHYQVERPQTGVDVITSRPSGEDGYFLLTITAGAELEEVASGMDYVFVVDISGSMANDGKLRLSRDCVSAFVDALGDADRFELLTFNVSPNPLFRALQIANGSAKQQVNDVLTRQRAIGGTVLRPALTTAFKYKAADRPLNVVVLSDGMTEQEEQRELVASIRQAPAGIRVFCIGVGNEVNRPLLSQLAEDAGGLASFISHGDDFVRQATEFRRKLTRPTGTNLQLQFAGAEVYDVEPQRLPNMYYGAPLRVYGRYRSAGDATLTLKGDILGSSLEKSFDISLAKKDDANPEIDRMWAQKRMQRLFQEERANGFDVARKNKIVELGEEYSITSLYTSFIVLENDGEYQRWKIERRNSNRLQRDRRARAAVQDKLAVLRENALAQLGPQVAADATRQDDAAREVAARTPAASRTPSSVVPDRSVDNSFAAPAAGDDATFTQPSGGGGGGAIDPLTGSIALAAAGAAYAARRRKRRRGSQSGDDLGGASVG